MEQEEAVIKMGPMHPENDGVSTVVANMTAQRDPARFTSRVPHPEEPIYLHGNSKGQELFDGDFFDVACKKKAPTRKLPDCQDLPKLFLNDIHSVWEHILSPESLPANKLHDEPVPGQVVPGTPAAMALLLEKKLFSEVDTGIVLNDKKLVVNNEKGYSQRRSYSVLYTIGAGTFGEACLCVDEVSKAKFVRKEIDANKINPSEVLVPARYPHPVIVLMYGCIKTHNQVEIFMEYAGFSFDKVVGNETLRGLLTEQEIIRIGCQGFDGLTFLKQHGVIHLDIKPQNMCLDWDYKNASFKLKLCDFGSSRHMGDSTDPSGWTPAYMAPEQCRYALNSLGMFPGVWSAEEREITPKVDVYSFALSLLYLCYWLHCVPKLFQDYKDLALIIQIAHFPEKVKLYIQESWDSRLQEVLNQSLCGHPEKRIEAIKAWQILTEPPVNTLKENPKSLAMDTFCVNETITQSTNETNILGTNVPNTLGTNGTINLGTNGTINLGTSGTINLDTKMTNIQGTKMTNIHGTKVTTSLRTKVPNTLGTYLADAPDAAPSLVSGPSQAQPYNPLSLRIGRKRRHPPEEDMETDEPPPVKKLPIPVEEMEAVEPDSQILDPPPDSPPDPNPGNLPNLDLFGF